MYLCGLCLFAAAPDGAYHSAARSFLDVSSDLGSSYADVLSCSDVVTYASICALASFSRKELKAILHGSSSVEFKKIIDSSSGGSGGGAQNIWKIILTQFYNSNYAKVFELLETIKVHTHTHTMHAAFSRTRVKSTKCRCSAAAVTNAFSCSRFVLHYFFFFLFLSPLL